MGERRKRTIPSCSQHLHQFLLVGTAAFYKINNDLIFYRLQTKKEKDKAKISFPCNLTSEDNKITNRLIPHGHLDSQLAAYRTRDPEQSA